MLPAHGAAKSPQMQAEPLGTLRSLRLQQAVPLTKLLPLCTRLTTMMSGLHRRRFVMLDSCELHTAAC